MRKRFLDDGRMGKYLRYALGEIVLVVIGILIALQLNVWKTDNQNNQLGEEYLENLVSDLEHQLEIIDGQIAFEESIISALDSADSYLRSEISTQELSTLCTRLFIRRTFVANMATFSSLKAKGDLELIGDNDLTNLVVRYYQQLEYLSEVVNNNNRTHVDDTYSKFVVNNEIGFSLNEDGEVVDGLAMNDRDRYTFSSNLVLRRVVADNNKKIALDVRKLTEELIATLKSEMTT